MLTQVRASHMSKDRYMGGEPVSLCPRSQRGLLPQRDSADCYNRAFPYSQRVQFILFRESRTQVARIFPFRALRYNPAKVSIADVVTQPYDKITPAMQEHYYKSSQHNLVRIILGKPEPQDDDEENVYSRAAAHLEKWRSDRVLLPDREPSIYRYTQTFRMPGDSTEYERLAFVAL